VATIPGTFVFSAGSILTAAQLNTYLTAAVTFLINVPAVELRQTSAQSFANGSTTTAMTWDTEDFDNDGMHNGTNPTRVTAQTAGRFLTGGGIAWTGSTTGRRGSWYRLNGSSVKPSGECMLQAGSASVVALPVRTISTFLNVGDYLELMGYQEAGGSLSTNVAIDVGEQPSFTLRWVGNT
jgi:hypothetical protein